MSFFKDFQDRFFGRGRASTTVPLMDGALKPNVALDNAARNIALDQADDIACYQDHIFVSAGCDLYELKESQMVLAHTFAQKITALAVSNEGRIAVAIAGQEIQMKSETGVVWSPVRTDGFSFSSISALCFASDGALLICDASQENSLENWRVDLLNFGATGRVLRIAANEQSVSVLMEKLAFPNGILEHLGKIYISEAWKHRIVSLDATTGARGINSLPLPAYPARLKLGGNFEIYLSCFAPRSQLFELVLRHNEYRTRMMTELPQENWIAPSLLRSRSYLDPLQGGAVKQLGIHKPWAPSASYGLVVQLNENLEVTRSYHSRADGQFHGTTAAIAVADELFVLSKSAGAVAVVSLAGEIN